MLKVCSKCGVEKDLETGFYVCRAKKSGYGTYCKECMSKYGKDYSLKNPNYSKDYQKVWRRTDIGMKSTENSGKKYRQTERYRDYIKIYSNLDYVKKKAAEYKQKAMGVFSHTREGAKKRGIDFNLDFDEFCKMYSESNGCIYCGHSIDYSLKLIHFIKNYDSSDERVQSLKNKMKAVQFSTKRLSVDRPDSFIGYLDKNRVMACVICNSSKGFFIHGDQYKLIAPAVIANIVKICTDAGLVI